MCRRKYRLDLSVLPQQDALTLALIAKFEEQIFESVRNAVAAPEGKDLRLSLRLVVHALIRTHRNRVSLHRLLELEEDRLRRSLGIRLVEVTCRR
jgi:hypothetical protein